MEKCVPPAPIPPPSPPRPRPSTQSPNAEAPQIGLGSRALDDQTPTGVGEGDFGSGEGGFGDEDGDGDGDYSEPDSGTVGDFRRSAPSTVNPREPHAHVDAEGAAYGVGRDIVSEMQPQFPDINAFPSEGESLRFPVFVFSCILHSKLQHCMCLVFFFSFFFC
jgi:hypothetical protein